MSSPLSPSPSVRSFAAHHYTDPEIFRIESAGLFNRTWQFAGHASQVANPGDYFTFELNGESLFCIRSSESDEIKVFYNICQPRAHELLSGDGNAKLIVCPYHA